MKQKSRSFPRLVCAARARLSRAARAGLTLSLAFAMLAGLTPLAPAPVSAQTGGEETAAAKTQRLYAPRQNAVRRGFILRDNGNDAACNVASPEEMRANFPAPGRKPQGRQINHLDETGAPEAGGGAAPNLTIILRAQPQLEANPTAKAAFVRAAANWEQVILSPVTVVIDVDFGPTNFGQPFDTGVIGATLGQELAFEDNYRNVRRSMIAASSSTQEQALNAQLPSEAQGVPTDLAAGNIHTTLIPSPVLRAIGEIKSVADNAEDEFYGEAPQVGFNSAIAFDFNPDDGIGGAQFDFDAVATHEIGHVLGFTSEEGVIEEFPTAPPLVTAWDIFRFPDTNATTTNFPTKQRTMRKTVVQHFEFNGKNPSPLQLSTGGPSGSGGDGEQGSHWQNRTAGNTIGIMDPRIGNGERNTIKVADLRALDAMGFRVNVDGGPGLPTPSPPVHDNFAAAKTLPSGSSGNDPFSSRYATREANETTHHPDSSLPTEKSAWYRWPANGGGAASVFTAGSNYDTVVAVYRQETNGTLTAIGKNDDVASGDLTSRVNVTAVSGQTYYFAVDGFLGTGGDANFQWTLPGTPPPTTTVTLSTSVASVTEGTNTRLDINVIRGGSTAGTSSVAYATSNVTAIDGQDYLAALGTVTFQPGETQKTISIFILDDVYGEGPETFQLTLSNPVGATLIAPGVTTVQINSNESANGLNPMRTTTNGVPSFNADFFVRQQYLDFFNREGDQPGIDFWRNQITVCGADQACIDLQKERVSSEFFRSIEFQTTGYFVYRAFAAAFGPNRIGSTVPLTLREFLPDTQQIGRGVVVGAPGWEAQIEANRVAFINDFISRTQFTGLYPPSGAQTPAQFIDALNANTGNSLSQAERDNLVNGLVGGTISRGQAFRAVIEDTDFANRERNRAFVLMQYFGYLRRNPYDAPEATLDFQGYNFWLGKLNQFNGDAVAAQMVRAFIVSEEYKLRFGP